MEEVLDILDKAIEDAQDREDSTQKAESASFYKTLQTGGQEALSEYFNNRITHVAARETNAALRKLRREVLEALTKIWLTESGLPF